VIPELGRGGHGQEDLATAAVCADPGNLDELAATILP